MGTEVELRVITPYHLSAVIKESVDRFLWETSTLRARDTPSITNKIKDRGPQDRNDIPNWALARRVVLGKDKAIGAMARSVCIYTQWPQSRINPNDELCRACGEWTGNLKHRQFPDCNMCSKYAEHAAKHLSTTTIEHLNNGLGGNIMANHAMLMKRHTPTIPQPVSANPIWRYGNRPTLFTGTVYIDGSTTINHSFPKQGDQGMPR